jgi:transcriptional repressor NrdR
MRCPFCGFNDSKVVDSRDVDESIRRRRECLNPECAVRFTTYERVQAVALYVVKKDGKREEFSRAKLLAGVRTACEKRPLAPTAVEALVDEIEQALYKAGDPEVPTSTIGNLVMDRLRALDPIAYVRFASVYRQFTDLAELQAELETLATAALPRAAQLPLSDPEFSATTLRLRPAAPIIRTRTRRPVRPVQTSVVDIGARKAASGSEPKRRAGDSRT